MSQNPVQIMKARNCRHASWRQAHQQEIWISRFQHQMPRKRQLSATTVHYYVLSEYCQPPQKPFGICVPEPVLLRNLKHRNGLPSYDLQ
eukprot:m.464676 g.464676  ORF g.464676 m.464676 type:complete len:89 (-) comp23664_c0_seq1:454-720(-)